MLYSHTIQGNNRNLQIIFERKRKFKWKRKHKETVNEYKGKGKKGGVQITQNIVKKGPTLITFDIKH